MREIRQLNENDFENINELSEFAFQYKLTDEEFKNKQKEANKQVIFGWEEGSALAAKVHIIPFHVHLNGKLFPMGGLASVASWPEYRRGGKIKELLKTALQDMKRKGQILSFLHPFSVPFYRKFGWELTFTKKEVTIPIKDLKKQWNANGYVRRMKKDDQTIELLQSIYTKYASQYAGPLERDKDWWLQRILNKDDIIAIAYNDNNDPEGYLIYQVKNNKCTIQDMAFQSFNGRKILFHFISNHDSMANEVTVNLAENDPVSLIIEEPRFQQHIIPYFMARIVDVDTFLHQYPYNQPTNLPSFIIKIEDEFMQDNCGTFLVEQEGTGIVVSRTINPKTDLPLVTISIQQLATIMLGYRNPNDLLELELITGDSKAVERLESIIPKQQPYFPDFF